MFYNYNNRVHGSQVKQLLITFFTWWNKVADIVQLEENIVFTCQKHGEIANFLNICIHKTKYVSVNVLVRRSGGYML